MILIDRKDLSPGLLLISDGEFFEAPLILMIFPNSDGGIRGTSLVPITLLSLSLCV